MLLKNFLRPKIVLYKSLSIVKNIKKTLLIHFWNLFAKNFSEIFPLHTKRILTLNTWSLIAFVKPNQMLKYTFTCISLIEQIVLLTLSSILNLEKVHFHNSVSQFQFIYGATYALELLNINIKQVRRIIW